MSYFAMPGVNESLIRFVKITLSSFRERLENMKRLTIALGLASFAVAQGYNSATMSPFRASPPPAGASYGNILNPGGAAMSHPARLGATIRGASPYPAAPGYPGHGGGRPPRTIVVPYGVPVWSGGYYNAYAGYGYGMPQAQPNITVVMPQQETPSVIINQYGADGLQTSTSVDHAGHAKTREPERSGMRVFEANPPAAAAAATPAPAPPASSAQDDKPNIYMIALSDETVRQAIGYWVEGNLLKYVTPQAKISSVPLAMVDRNASARLNAQNKLELELPPQFE